MKELYMAPMNALNNNSFRELCLFYGADFVFTEMIWVEDIVENKDYLDRKLKCSNVPRTIFQICAKNASLIPRAVSKLKEIHPSIVEINYNMGCPQSSLAKRFIAGGILRSVEEMERVSKIFFDACSSVNVKASIKLRLGPMRGKITINEYIKLLSSIGITKFYVHGRTLGQSYHIPAIIEEVNKVKTEFPKLTIIGNGDVRSFSDYNKINCDGVMIGRKALEDARVFRDIKEGKDFAKINQFSLESRKELFLKFLEFAKVDNLEMYFVKTILIWMSKEVEGGSKFRAKLQYFNSIDEIVKWG